MVKRIFKIDVSSLTREQAEQAVRDLMKSYNEDIYWNPRWLIEYERKRLLKNRREK